MTKRQKTAPPPQTKSLQDLAVQVDIMRDPEDEEFLAIPRPKVRGDCAKGPRPCPWVGCKYHLYLDVNEETGSIKFNFPDKNPWELDETCSLDASKEEKTLDEVGKLANVSRERIRQIESKALVFLRLSTDPSLDPSNSSDQ